MQKNRLIFIACMILLTLIVLIFFIVRSGNSNTNQPNGSVNTVQDSSGKRLAYAGNVIQYGDEVYVLDDEVHALMKYNIKESKSTKLINFEGVTMGERFFIHNNRLIFSYNNVSYYSNLNGSNINKMTDGEVIYMNDEVYLYLNHEENRDELFITSYDSKTLRATNKITHHLANGNTIHFLKNIEDSLYFTSHSIDDVISLFEVDLKNNKVSVISKINYYVEDDNLAREFSDIIKTDSSYFYVVSYLSLMTDITIYDESYMLAKMIESDYEEFYDTDVLRYLAYDPKDKNNIFYKRYADGTGAYVWHNTKLLDTTYDWKEFAKGDITALCEPRETGIYLGDDELVDFEGSISGYSMEKVISLGDAYYVLLENDYAHNWYYCSQDGTRLELMF